MKIADKEGNRFFKMVFIDYFLVNTFRPLIFIKFINNNRKFKLLAVYAISYFRGIMTDFFEYSDDNFCLFGDRRSAFKMRHMSCHVDRKQKWHSCVASLSSAKTEYTLRASLDSNLYSFKTSVKSCLTKRL